MTQYDKQQPQNAGNNEITQNLYRVIKKHIVVLDQVQEVLLLTLLLVYNISRVNNTSPCTLVALP